MASACFEAAGKQRKSQRFPGPPLMPPALLLVSGTESSFSAPNPTSPQVPTWAFPLGLCSGVALSDGWGWNEGVEDFLAGCTRRLPTGRQTPQQMILS